MIGPESVTDYPSLVETALLTLAICLGFEWKARRK